MAITGVGACKRKSAEQHCQEYGRVAFWDDMGRLITVHFAKVNPIQNSIARREGSAGLPRRAQGFDKFPECTVAPGGT